jgi:hypothetical protein
MFFQSKFSSSEKIKEVVMLTVKFWAWIWSVTYFVALVGCYLIAFGW